MNPSLLRCLPASTPLFFGDHTHRCLLTADSQKSVLLEGSRRRRGLSVIRAELDKDSPRVKGIFEFVTDNPSSKNAIQLSNTPAQDGNLGQMITSIEGKGREYGRYVRAGEFRWFVRELGPESGPVVLLLHGVPTQSYSFRNVMKQLADNGFRCIAPDWLGFGFSEKPQPGYDFSYTEEAFHQELDRLLEALGIDEEEGRAPINLLVQGYILGSYGLTWALKNADRLEHVAVLNTPLTAAATSSLPTTLAQLRLPFVGEFACQNAILSERFVEKGSPYVLELNDADVYRLPYLDSSEPGFSLLETARKAPLKEMAVRITDGFTTSRWTVPIVVVWGSQDKYLAQSEADAFKAQNPSAVTVSVVEGAGHMPQEDWPEKVVESLVKFFG